MSLAGTQHHGADEPFLSQQSSSDRTPTKEPIVGISVADGPVHAAKPSSGRYIFASIYGASLVVLITLLIAWLARLRAFGIDAQIIGGNLSQTQAKAVDFIAGALLAPLVVAGMNVLWFTGLRTTVANSASPAVSIETLVTAGATDAGNYSPFVIWPLLRGWQRNFVLFASGTLLSAVAKSALSNIIAYEAFNAAQQPATSTLRTMLGVNTTSFLANGAKYGFSNDMYRDFASQFFGMMTDVAYQNGKSKLEDGYYIGVNATRASMDSLGLNFVELRDVPGYRLRINCTPEPPGRFDAVQMGGYKFMMTALFDNTSTTGEGLLQGELPGQTTILTNAYNDVYSWLGFSLNASEVYFSTLTSFNLTDAKNDIETPYGVMKWNAWNMTGAARSGLGDTGFGGTKSIMSATGLRCKVQRQEGKHNLTRTPGGPWVRRTSTYDGEWKFVSVWLKDWQMPLNYHSPPVLGTESGQNAVQGMSGFGPAFSNSATVCTSPGGAEEGALGTRCISDWKIKAENFLHATGEIQRIAYEVKSSNLTTTPAANDVGALVVSCVETQLRYRITYVPAILLVGALATILTTIICGVLLALTFGTLTTKSWNEVHALRLLVDAVKGLRESEGLDAVQARGNGELESWAKGYHVRYSAIAVSGREGAQLHEAAKI